MASTLSITAISIIIVKGGRHNKPVSTYGGIVPILSKINKCGIRAAINKNFEKRAKQAAYSYGDVILGWVTTSLCNGKRIVDSAKLAKQLKKLPIVKLPSHDTIGRVLKSLATEINTKQKIGGRGKKMSIHDNEYNENEKLNRVLIESTKRIGALRAGIPYTLHIDAMFIQTNCRTSKKKLKTKNEYTQSRYGFNPMICLIDDMPVYISMRNGDVNCVFDVKECLERCITLLGEYNITVGKVISDGASYTTEMIEMLHERKTSFNIHMHFNSYFKRFFRKVDNIEDWKPVTLETVNHRIDCEVGEVFYRMHASKNLNRVILARIPDHKTILKTETQDEKQARLYREAEMLKREKNNQLKSENRGYKLGEWKYRNGYYYKIIITNDRITSRENLILEYNSRGGAERKFDFMKNDFGWKYPPFMKMNENTVFMIVAAIANNIYRGVLHQFSKQIKQLRNNMRLPTFFDVFIDVACWFDAKNNFYEIYDEEIAFEKLLK